MLTPSICYADAFAPQMIYLFGLPMLIPFLLVIVIIETITFKVALKDDYLEVIVPVLRANIISALAGIPIAGIWPFSTYSLTSGWSTWAAICTVVSIPIMLVVSVYIEYYVLKGHFDFASPDAVKRASWTANLFSYVFLIGALLMFILLYE